MAAKVGNDHAKLVFEQGDQRIEHRAADHEAVEQEQRLATSGDPVENAVRGAVLARRWSLCRHDLTPAALTYTATGRPVRTDSAAASAKAKAATPSA